jgi:hypothetical protein
LIGSIAVPTTIAVPAGCPLESAGEIDAQTRLGRLRISGRQAALLAAIAAVTIIALGYFYLRPPNGVAAEIRTRLPQVAQQHVEMFERLDGLDGRLKALTEQQAHLVEEQQVTNYLLSLPATERPRLKAPDALRDRIIVVPRGRRAATRPSLEWLELAMLPIASPSPDAPSEHPLAIHQLSESP